MMTRSIHVLCEIYGVEFDRLNNRKFLEQVLTDAALEAGAEVREVAFQNFSPQGVSGVVIISESHLTIHTFPEENYCAVDIFTCGDKIDPMDACNYLLNVLQAKKSFIKEFERGNGEIKELTTYIDEKID